MSDVDHEKEQLWANLGVHTGSIENQHAHAMKNSGGGGRRGGGCFPKGTNITTPRGLRDISTLQAGDAVTTVNPNDHTRHTRKILKHLSHAMRKVWCLQFADGSFIRTTGIHSFSVQGTWCMAYKIIPGVSFTVFEKNGAVVEKLVERSYETNETENVYNLIVEGDFSFVADGAVVHSFSYFRTVRAMGWTVYDGLSRLLQPKQGVLMGSPS